MFYALIFMCNTEGLCKPVTDKLGPYKSEQQCNERVLDMRDELLAKLEKMDLPDSIEITFTGGCGNKSEYLEALNG